MDERTKEYVRKQLQKIRKDWWNRYRKAITVLAVLILAAVGITPFLLPRRVTFTFVTDGRSETGADATLSLTGRYSDYRWGNDRFKGTVTLSEQGGETRTLPLDGPVQQTGDTVRIGPLTYNPATLSARLSDETDRELFRAEGVLPKEGESDG